MSFVIDRRSTWLLGVATAASGFAALVFETIWTRQFAIVLGSTVEAASTVFAAFFTGLAVGAFAGGRATRRIERTAMLCAALELSIGISGLAIGALLGRSTELAVMLAGGLGTHRTLTAYFAALVLVGVPTALIGAAFPFVVAIARRLDLSPSGISRLYGINILGAGLGTIVSGFWSIRLAGVNATLAMAAGANLLSALSLVRLSAAVPAGRTGQESGDLEAPATPGSEIPTALGLAVAFGSGLVVLALELAWLRFASFFLGNRTFAVSTLLASVLLLLALGAHLASFVSRVSPFRTGTTLGLLCLAGALGIHGTTLIVDLWIPQQQAREAVLPALETWLLFYRFLESLLFMAPAFVPLGALFPLALTSCPLFRRSPGHATGCFYLVNTVGCVTGSLLTGFVGMSELGAFGCASVSALASAVLSVPCFAAAGIVRALSGLALALVVSLIVMVPRPPLEWLTKGETLLHRKEDAHGVFQLTWTRQGTMRAVCNKTALVFDLGPPITSYVQQMLGHLAVFYRPGARTAAVLGNGFGITTGALARYPSIVSVDAVEILPAFAEIVSRFDPFNSYRFWAGKVSLHVGDGRHFLAAAGPRFDIVSVNVSDPRIPGGASLYHREFYDLAKRRLVNGGVVVQHVFGSARLAAIATLAASFRHVRLFRSYGNGYMAVASDGPLEVDARRLAGVTSPPAVAAALAEIGLVSPLTPANILREAILPGDVPGMSANIEVATDDRPLIEFGWSDDPRQIFHSNE